MSRGSVLVSGGAGYLGSHVVLRLLEAGWRVVVVDDLTTGRRDAVPDGALFVEGNAGDGRLIRCLLAAHSVRAVMHLAGCGVADPHAAPIQCYDNTVSTSLSLIAGCIDAGVEVFVFPSSAAVYGESSHVPVAEDVATEPTAAFGSAKLCTEYMLRDAARVSRMRYVVLRCFDVAGADPLGRAGPVSRISDCVVRSVVLAASGRRSPVDIFGTDFPTPDGTFIRDYVHVSDLAEAHLLALEHLFAGGGSGVFNCGYGHGHSVRQVIAACEWLLGESVPSRPAPARAGDPPILVADSRRLRERLGWKPRYDDLRLIVDTTLRWESAMSNAA